MKILLGLTYYRPHLSGLTLYVERLAKGLRDRGHHVTILASRHERSLPKREERDGVEILRVPVAMRISKGVVMPSYPTWAWRAIGSSDVVNLHLPQFEAPLLALTGRARRKPVVMTYHCDIELPKGAMNRIVQSVVRGANWVAARSSDRVVAYTRDYANHSKLLSKVSSEKIEIILPPVEMPPPAPDAVRSFTELHGLEGPTIGIAARFATEKGIEVLLDALPGLTARFPSLTVLFAGPYEDIAGEEAYRERLFPRIGALGARWRFLGPLDPLEEMPAFLGALDCLLVPSVNSTESFGLVQVEAMLSGTPVVASDLPGVREPVRMTSMGEVVPAGDPLALERAIGDVIYNEDRYLRSRDEIEKRFDLETTISAYEALFEDLVRSAHSTRSEPGSPYIEKTGR